MFEQARNRLRNIYHAADWYWIVGGDETKAWSSAQGAYVPPSDAAFTAWREFGRTPTRIDNEVLLFDVLSKAGLAAKAPSRNFTTSEIVATLRAVDAGVNEKHLPGVDPSTIEHDDSRIGANAAEIDFHLGAIVKG